MSPEDYDWLFEHGIALQLNLMSLAGTYGPSPLRRAEDLLAKSYYTFIGSDCHRRVRTFPATPEGFNCTAQGVELTG